MAWHVSSEDNLWKSGLSFCGFQEFNVSVQALEQAPLPVKPSCQP